MILTFKLNPQNPDALPSLVNRMLGATGHGVLLTPDNNVEITKSSQLPNLVKSWPRWPSRPWIIAGKKNANSSSIDYSGPYIKDCSDDGFNLQVKNLLSVFDWALFSYFTTYHDDHYIIVSNELKIENLVGNKSTAHIFVNDAIYSFDINDPISCLPSTSFYDYDVEGYFAYDLAIERGEDPPFLLCNVSKDPDDYRRWNNEAQEIERNLWYEEAIAK